MPNLLTESADSATAPAPIAQAAGDNGRRSLRERTSRDEVGAGGCNVVQTAKFLARDFLRRKGIDAKLTLREFARQHGVHISTLQYQLKHVSDEERFNLHSIGREEAEEQERQKRAQAMEQQARMSTPVAPEEQYRDS
jgi:AraC-like DNA-binding protein